jgi:hypothetical protein
MYKDAQRQRALFGRFVRRPTVGMRVDRMQITRIGAVLDGRLGDQVDEHIGGDVRAFTFLG